MDPSEWTALAEWWVGEVRSDPAYESDVLPLLDALVPNGAGSVIDLGCGEGQGMRRVRSRPADRLSVIGCDVNRALLARAVGAGPCVRTRLPDVGWLRSNSVAGAFAVLVLEHLPAVEPLLLEAARFVQPDGFLVVVLNHPAYTPPGAGPIIDQSDGEPLWRWGDYFVEAAGDERVGAATVRFHHRPLGTLLNQAAAAGWSLERFEERPLSEQLVERDPSLAGQEHFPRLLGVRWRLR